MSDVAPQNQQFDEYLKVFIYANLLWRNKEVIRKCGR